MFAGLRRRRSPFLFWKRKEASEIRSAEMLRSLFQNFFTDTALDGGSNLAIEELFNMNDVVLCWRAFCIHFSRRELGWRVGQRGVMAGARKHVDHECEFSRESRHERKELAKVLPVGRPFHRFQATDTLLAFLESL